MGFGGYAGTPFKPTLGWFLTQYLGQSNKGKTVEQEIHKSI